MSSPEHDQSTIGQLKDAMAASGLPFLLREGADNSAEYVEFRFLGEHEGREVIFDTALYTLRLQHESELFEIAEQKAMAQFPDYRKIVDGEKDDPVREEEIGLYMAEVILEIEEEEGIKVQEHVDMDTTSESGISLDVGLHVDAITTTVIRQFIRDFNAGTLALDDTLYSFQTEEDAD